MDRDQKKKSAEELHEELMKAQGIVLSGFQGITVSQDFELRRKVAGTGARYKVVKNSLIERAAKGTPVEPIAQKLAGTTSVALTEADPVALAKALTEYAKENPIFTFKCGVVEGRVVSLADFGALATLPSKEAIAFQGAVFVQFTGAAGGIDAVRRGSQPRLCDFAGREGKEIPGSSQQLTADSSQLKACWSVGC